MRRDPRQAGVRGQIAELVCAAAALECGWDWAWASDGFRFDGLICFDSRNPNNWQRIQVKRIYLRKYKRRRDRLCVALCSGKARYKKNDADYLAAVHVESGQVYLFPWEMVYRRWSMTIDPEKHQNFLVPNPWEKD